MYSNMIFLLALNNSDFHRLLRGRGFHLYPTFSNLSSFLQRFPLRTLWGKPSGLRNATPFQHSDLRNDYHSLVTSNLCPSSVTQNNALLSHRRYEVVLLG